MDFRPRLESLENRRLLANSVVAIVDSGIDHNHSYLKENLWSNPYEVVDGLDNDKNGYIDDINGWDFVNNDKVPEDSFYHGTFVSGVVKSVNPDVKIMMLKFQDGNGLGYTGAAASAINYATNMKLKGIDVASINLSWGGGTSSSLGLESSIKRANDAGIIVVSASGNNADNTDITPRYPSSYKLTNSISVAAWDGGVSLAGFSNYGKNSVEVAAKGVGVYSSLPNNSYGYISGTSFAAPYVSGLVSLLKNVGNYSATQIKQSILQGSTMLSGLVDKVGYGLVSVSNSLNYIKTLVPMGSTNVIVIPPVVSAPVVGKILYGFNRISRSNISGWVREEGNTANKLTVEIKINNKVAYSGVAADSYSVNLKRFFRLKKNLVEIRFIDSVNNRSVLGYSGIIRR